MDSPQQPKLRLKDRRRRLMWVKVVAGTSVVALSLGLVFYVSHLQSMTISQVTVSGTNLVSAADVQSIASAELSGSYAFLVPHANAFVAPTASIKNKIQNSFPPVANVSISTKDLKTLEIAVTERTPIALWCGGTPSGEIANDGSAVVDASEAENKNCYLMDSGGYIFAPATASAYVHFFGALSGTPVGTKYLEGDFAALNKIIEDIGISIQRTPKEVLVDNEGKDVSLAFAEGGVVRFSRSTDREGTLDNIASVFASPSFQQHSNFEYVDFRFGDKVYVKFK